MVRMVRQRYTDTLDLCRLEIREYKSSDKCNLFKILNEYRRDFYISVYKKCFKSWFAYAFTAVVMSICYLVFEKHIVTLFAAPLMVTTYVLYRVNRYRQECRMLTINDIEKYALDQSGLKRKKNQGVYVCSLDDKLLAYCVYIKEIDEDNTVRIKEICVSKESRKNGIGKYFFKHLYDHVFKACKLTNIVFTFSMFNEETNAYCLRHNLTQTDCWQVFSFLPGVADKRVSYSIHF
jgi:hypothetical protein